MISHGRQRPLRLPRALRLLDAGIFQIRATLSRNAMWSPGEYQATITAATNCGRDGAYLMFDPISSNVRIEYRNTNGGGLVGRGVAWEVRSR